MKSLGIAVVAVNVTGAFGIEASSHKKTRMRRTKGVLFFSVEIFEFFTNNPILSGCLLRKLDIPLEFSSYYSNKDTPIQ